MAQELGATDEVADMREEDERLARFVNEQLWDEPGAFYFDRWDDGRRSGVRSIGAYWALLAGVVPRDRLDRFVAQLEDPRRFNRPHRVPSLAADTPGYQATGDYWRGGVWVSTNYMVLRGLTEVGRDALAHEIARNHVGNVVSVFETTGTLWENYAPESAAPGTPARPDFVGWGGLPPIGVLLEYVFGLRPDAPARRLVWDVRLVERHGVKRYPFGRDVSIDLSCAARRSVDERPRLEAKATAPVDLELRWAGRSEVVRIGPR
jgi:glycogen debranching enzyme